MADIQWLDGGITAVPGILAAGVTAGIKPSGKKDLALIYSSSPARAAAVFTTNQVKGAPVLVSRDHVKGGQAQAIVASSGCSNVCTGEQGVRDAREMTKIVGEHLRIPAQRVLIAATGVIGQPMPMDKVRASLPKLVKALSPQGSRSAAEAIMTTDTVPKAFSARAQVGGATVTITGISKGAGMIRPNMATMLGFIATDAKVTPELLQQLATELAEGSFNRVTVDGDTSTNDSFVVIASTQAAHAPITSLDSADGRALKAAMLGVARLLAQAIGRDGEGATKFITVRVEGGRDGAECRQVAYAIAHSPLVKTAFFASDPNLGRILAAVGYAGIADLDQTGIDLYLDDVHVAVKGGRNPAYREEDGQRVMKQAEITVRVVLGRGTAADTVWTCDFSHDYVTINADYRS